MGRIDIDIAKVESWNGAPDGPVVMLNLYRFKDAEAMAEYSARISEVMGAAVARAGGDIIYSGRVGPEFVANEQWDSIGLVRYPSYAAMVSIFEDRDTRDAMEELRRSTLIESRFMLTCEQNIFGAIQE